MVARRRRPARRVGCTAVDAVGELQRSAPEQIEVKRLAGQIVWLREGGDEWVGPADEALARLRDLAPETAFWAAFSSV
jgi:hypothetical protein